MSARFLDTNVLIHAFSPGPLQVSASRLLYEGFTLSAQNLNEFVNVSRRKLRREWPAIEDGLADLIRLADTVEPVTLETHLRGISVAQRYRLSTYDAILIASALLAGANLFLSQDMHDGLVVENQLTIRNPFV